jgi:hypothetical protein
MKHTLFKPPLVTAIAVLLAVTTTFTGGTAQASPLSNTEAFLRASFTNGQFVAGFTPGKPDFGFSLEALLQRKVLGETADTLEPAVKYLLTSTAQTGTVSNPNGYLFNSGKLRLGLAGKWAFVSSILKAGNGNTRRQIISAALSKVDGSGDVAPDAGANTYDRAWLILGLAANDRARQAVTLATNLASHQLADGGFNDGFTLGSSSSDGTGITLQALAAARGLATQSQRRTLNASIDKAVAYLNKAKEGDHFSNYGDYDLNGTAYAAMGLKSVGAQVGSIQNWIKSKLASDGGLQTPWSGGTGDIYATAQGATALLGQSYAGLLPKAGQSQGGTR